MAWRLNVLTVVAKVVVMAVIVLTGARVVHNVTVALGAAAQVGHLLVRTAALN